MDWIYTMLFEEPLLKFKFIYLDGTVHIDKTQNTQAVTVNMPD